jgi:hypothetical protein
VEANPSLLPKGACIRVVPRKAAILSPAQQKLKALWDSGRLPCRINSPVTCDVLARPMRMAQPVLACQAHVMHVASSQGILPVWESDNDCLATPFQYPSRKKKHSPCRKVMVSVVIRVSYNIVWPYPKYCMLVNALA